MSTFKNAAAVVLIGVVGIAMAIVALTRTKSAADAAGYLPLLGFCVGATILYFGIRPRAKLERVRNRPRYDSPRRR
jgi:hypothetical protein